MDETVDDTPRSDTEADRPESGGGKRYTFADVTESLRGRDLPNAMTVDVEDYFQVSAFENHVSRDRWKQMPCRIPRNVDVILKMFDDADVKATFFALGWVARHFPSVLRDIVAAGHELASHGNDHVRVGALSREQFRSDVEGTRKRLEDVSGAPVRGYRAPSFSIGQETLWAHDIIAEAGYAYSSSVFPISHDHYGLPDAPRFPFHAGNGTLLEVPLTSVRLMGRNWPCAGGGYFRLLPLAYSRWATRRVNEKDRMPTIFYFHPWELDPDQPRIDGLPFKARFRHYVNLGKFQSRLDDMLRQFRWGRMDQIFLGPS